MARKFLDYNGVSRLSKNIKDKITASGAENKAYVDAKLPYKVYVQDTEPTDAVAGDLWVDTATTLSYAEGASF